MSPGKCVETPTRAPSPASARASSTPAVLLADVAAVGARRRHEVRAVVEDQQRPRVVAEAPRDRRGREQLVVGRGLVAQLDDVDAALQRPGEDVLKRASRGPQGAHEVQDGLLQAGTAVGRGGHERHCRNVPPGSAERGSRMKGNGSP